MKGSVMPLAGRSDTATPILMKAWVAVTTANTVREVAAAVAGHVEGKRVRALPYEKVVFHNGRRLSPDITVAEAGIAPLDHVRVEYDIPAGSPKEGMR